jgi:FAD/FMN-containing dehydrogenase
MSAATPDATLIDALHRVPELDGIVHDAASDKNWNKLIRPWYDLRSQRARPVPHRRRRNVRCAPTPLAVVVASTAQQVSATVRFGAQHGLAVQARSGGHSYGSFALGGADGALVVDLSPMDQVIVDPVTDPDAVVRAEIGAGTRLGRVSEELFRQGGRAIGLCARCTANRRAHDDHNSTWDVP